MGTVRRAVIAALVLAGVVAGTARGEPPPPEMNGKAASVFAEFRNMGPHRAFATGPADSAYWWAGVGGPDPDKAVTSALKRCEEQTKATCSLHVVNNYTVSGQNWRDLVPARAPGVPDIGRLRPQPYWAMRGPQLAAGLIVWSHGYQTGNDSTNSAPQLWTGRFANAGYDLYRFDRQWIADWVSDATALAAAIRKAREMGYRRILLAGQSAGGWVSLAALTRDAPVDGVISIAAAHHGEVAKMQDPPRARREWQQVVSTLRPGPRVVIVNFADDAYDVGNRMADARDAFKKSGVEADVIDNPEGFKGHGAGLGLDFARKFGPCIQSFIEKGTRLPPC